MTRRVNDGREPNEQNKWYQRYFRTTIQKQLASTYCHPKKNQVVCASRHKKCGTHVLDCSHGKSTSPAYTIRMQ